MRRILVLLLLICLPAAAFAADPFKNIVKAVEREYGVRHHGVPWFARVFFKPALWGSGVSGLKIAEFEHGSLRDQSSHARIADTIERTVGPEWQQIVRIRSRADNETVYVYVRPSGEHLTMLVASVEQDEASVVQMTMNPTRFAKWTEDTEFMAVGQRKHRNRKEESENTQTLTLVSSNTPGGYGILVP